MIKDEYGKFYIEVPAENRYPEDVCYQCDYMQNKGFLIEDCPRPCDPESLTVLKEVDYAYL